MRTLLLIGCIHLLITISDAQRKPTTTRRRRMRTPPTTMGFEESMYQHRQAKEQNFKFQYNPNFGYEPYWVEGAFILTTTLSDRQKGITTSKVPTVCGDECNYLLRRIKHVCAHKSTNNPVYGCYDASYCTGKAGHDLSWDFRTFNTYCEFLDAQCRDHFTKGRYVLVHIGKCLRMDDTFKPVWEGWQPVTRMKNYLKDFYSRFPTTVLTVST